MNELEKYFLNIISKKKYEVSINFIGNNFDFLKKYHFNIKYHRIENYFSIYFNNELIGTFTATETIISFAYYYNRYPIDYTYEEFIKLMATIYKNFISK